MERNHCATVIVATVPLLLSQAAYELSHFKPISNSITTTVHAELHWSVC